MRAQHGYRHQERMISCMSRVMDYVNKLIELYGDEICYKKSSYDADTLSQVPEALREFYSEFADLETPFGYIKTIENARKHSDREPFKKEGWFSFGFDGYFSFWLCLCRPDEENLSLTSWDHGGSHEIGEAVYEDLIEFLEVIREEYEENKDE